MAALGEFALWTALPLLALSAIASLAGGWIDRRGLWRLGGRAGVAAAAFLGLGMVGLGRALVDVNLGFAYVATYSGFEVPWVWRLAALWTGPSGAALTLVVVMGVTTALSHASRPARQVSARTGSLAALTLVGLVMVIARARPFAPATTARGSGLPAATHDLAWQLELWLCYLAVGAAAFAFMGVLGGQLVESRSRLAAEARAARLATALLAGGTLLAAWRAYGSTGHLLGGSGLPALMVPGAALLVGVAYIHAPDLPLAPAWAARWRQMLAVALFPASVGAAAAVLAGAVGQAPALLWAGGIAVGLVAGGLAGFTPPRTWSPQVEELPGLGIYALVPAVGALALAGLCAILGLLALDFWPGADLWILLATLLTIALWASVRSGPGRWPTRALPLTVGVAASAAAYLGGARGSFGLVLGTGLGAIVVLGSALELPRLRAARRAPTSEPMEREVHGERSRRRRASALAHAAFAFIAVAIVAEGASVVQIEPLEPGDQITAGGAGSSGAPTVTYLGLSRYQVDTEERRVASFRVRGPNRSSSLLTASATIDLTTGRQRERVALRRGLLGDLIVGIEELGGDERIVCRVVQRPLASFFWLGGVALIPALLLGVAPHTVPGKGEGEG